MLFKETEIENLHICRDLAKILNDFYFNEFIENKFYLKDSQYYKKLNDIFLNLHSLIIDFDKFLFENEYVSFEFIHKYEKEINIYKFYYTKSKNIYEFRNRIKKFLNETRNFLLNISDIKEYNGDLDLKVSSIFEGISEIDLIDHNEEELSKKNNKSGLIRFIDQNDKSLLINSDLDNKVDNLILNYSNLFEENNNKFELNYKKKLEEYQDFLSSSHSDFKIKSDNLLQKFNDEITLSKLNFKKSVDDEILEFGKKFSKVDTDFKNTVKDFEVLKKFINAKGEKEVTDHYRNKAKWERITYWLMTLITFGIIIYSVSMATNGLNEYKSKANISVEKLLKDYPNQPVEKIEKLFSATQSSALTYLVLRLLFSILLFSSIIYTSRVAYRAYIHMRHSENMMLKLATLRPFINQLDESERNQIHKDLVPDYFGKDAGLVDGASEKFKDLPANVSAVAMKAIEQIGGSTSNNSTKESNTKEPKEAKNLI